MQNRITTPGPLHDEQGHLIETGYATELIKNYDRKRVAARRTRIKEWAAPIATATMVLVFHTPTSFFPTFLLDIIDSSYMKAELISC